MPFRDILVLSLLTLWAASMVFHAPVVASIVMMALLALSLVEVKGTVFRVGIYAHLKDNFISFWKRKDFVVLLIPFVLVLGSSLYAQDVEYTLERLRIKLPFLILPFSIYSLESFGKPLFKQLLWIVSIIVSVSGLVILANYMMHFEAINTKLSQGQAIPTGVHHIRYNLFLVFSIIATVFLWKERSTQKDKRYKKWIVVMGLFQVVLLHILSVKSGLIAFYFILMYWVGILIFKNKKYKTGFAILLVVIGVPLFAYFTLPSFKQKIHYTLWDLKMYQEGKGKNYSDSERLISLQQGWEIFRENPIFGIGAGDLKKEVEKKYAENFPQFKAHRPHNQYLSILAGTGMIGFAAFIFMLGMLLFFRKNYLNPFFTSIVLLVCWSFMVENTIESALGVSMFCFVILLPLRALFPKQILL